MHPQARTDPHQATSSHPARVQTTGRGFTLIETLVSLAVVGLGFTFTVPAFLNMVQRSKVQGATQEAAQLLRQARSEAVRFHSPSVVAIDPASREIYSFVDVHGADTSAPPDGLFNPIAGVPEGATDFEIRRITLAAGVEFRFLDSRDEESVDGFDNTGNPDPPDSQAVFESLGSALAPGAFRLADQHDNYLEIRVSPRGTARVALRKWDGTAWREFGEGGHPWRWN